MNSRPRDVGRRGDRSLLRKGALATPCTSTIFPGPRRSKMNSFRQRRQHCADDRGGFHSHRVTPRTERYGGRCMETERQSLRGLGFALLKNLACRRSPKGRRWSELQSLADTDKSRRRWPRAHSVEKLLFYASDEGADDGFDLSKLTSFSSRAKRSER